MSSAADVPDIDSDASLPLVEDLLATPLKRGKDVQKKRSATLTKIKDEPMAKTTKGPSAKGSSASASIKPEPMEFRLRSSKQKGLSKRR